MKRKRSGQKGGRERKERREREGGERERGEEEKEEEKRKLVPPRTMAGGRECGASVGCAILKSQSIFFKLSASHGDTANESRGTIHPSE